MTLTRTVSRRVSLLATAGNLGLAALIVLIVVPSIPGPVGAGLDAGWIWGLNMAHAKGLLFGTQLVFTYGPLGYLAFPAFPEAEHWAVLAFGWGLAAVTAYALWRVVRVSSHAVAWLYIGGFWLCGVALLAEPTSPVERINFAAIALAVSIAMRLREPWVDSLWVDVGLLFVLGAVALLTKLSLAIAPVAMALYFTGLLVRRALAKGGRPWISAAGALLAFPIAFAGLFWASDGTLRGMASYLRSSSEIVNGYSDAMAVAGPLWIVGTALMSCLVLFLGVPLLSGEPRRLALGLAPAAVFAFVCFKSAMVREDGHCVPFQFELALAALLIGAFASTARTRGVIGLFCLVSVGLGLIVQNSVWPQLAPGEWDRATGRSLSRDVELFLDWHGTVRALEALSDNALAPARIPPELGIEPLLQGKRVAAFPFQLDLIRANHLQWQALPIMQAYSAYTTTLDRMNAGQLSGPPAPDEVLLSWTPIDGHHPFYESPQTWRELLNHYDLQLASPGLYVLGRRNTPRFDESTPMGETKARWGQDILLPPAGDHEIVVMQAVMSENFPGVLDRELLRAPAIYVRATLASGVVASGRVVRMNAAGGVIVSDWPETLDDVAPMFHGRRAAPEHRVVSIQLRPDAPGLLRPAISIRWSRLKIRRPAELDQPDELVR
jgi:hypothetical protein